MTRVAINQETQIDRWNINANKPCLIWAKTILTIDTTVTL